MKKGRNNCKAKYDKDAMSKKWPNPINNKNNIDNKKKRDVKALVGTEYLFGEEQKEEQEGDC